VANIIVVVDKTLDFVLCGCFGWGGRKVYVAEKYMAELSELTDADLFRWLISNARCHALTVRSMLRLPDFTTTQEKSSSFVLLRIRVFYKAST
jgi:hypothetical protein